MNPGDKSDFSKARELADMARQSICVPGGEMALGEAIDSLIQQLATAQAENARLHERVRELESHCESLSEMQQASEKKALEYAQFASNLKKVLKDKIRELREWKRKMEGAPFFSVTNGGERNGLSWAIDRLNAELEPGKFYKVALVVVEGEDK